MSDRIGNLLQKLISSLDEIHHEEPALHRLWLESLYVRGRSNSGVIRLPLRWQLSVFTLVRDGQLNHRPEVAEAAKQFADSMHRMVCHDHHEPQNNLHIVR
jgi:hypothetical protein